MMEEDHLSPMPSLILLINHYKVIVFIRNCNFFVKKLYKNFANSKTFSNLALLLIKTQES